MPSGDERWMELHRHFMMPWMAQDAGQRGPVISRGEGSYLIDTQGRRYLDLSSGWVACNLGHANPHVTAAIKEQLDKLPYLPPNFLNDTRAEYSAALTKLAPWAEGSRVHFTTGGADANDDAMKMSRILTGRNKILAAYRSFHGSTSGAVALTGGNRRWAAEPATATGVVHFFAPYPYRSPFYTDDPAEETRRALEHFERVVLQENPNSIAAVLLEPVVGSDGLIVYPEGYLAGLRRISEKHGFLLIFDEVMTGFGRVGEAFAAQRFGVTPDMITFAKGSTSSYVPLGGVLVREKFASVFDKKPFEVGHTFSGHPLAMAAGLGALKAYEEGKLLQRGREIEGWIKEELSALQQRHRVIGDWRGVGAFFGIEFVKNRATKEAVVPWQGAGPVMGQFFRGLLESGVWMMNRYSIGIISPPLTITRAELADGFRTVSKVIEQHEGKMLDGG